jgi:hypothetical protein
MEPETITESPLDLKSFQYSSAEPSIESEPELSEEDLLSRIQSFKNIKEDNFDEALKIAKMALARLSLVISDTSLKLLDKSNATRYCELQGF